MSETIGHYEIVEEIGRGGMGVVYKAREASLNRMVAVKVLGQHLAQDREYITRFQREAQAAAALNHPNIIQIYTIGEDSGRHYFAMEYVDGHSVQEMIRQQGRIPAPKAGEIVLEAAKGLAAAHDSGLIHRDIKPANLMVDKNGIVKIADFGLALRPADQTRITSSGLLMGTPGYLAPEQCLDRAVDPRTDIYALGVSLFEMLTGKAPFTADSPAALIRKIVDGDTPDPAALAPDLDPELRRIVLKMMARDPDQRYQTCYQVAGELASFVRSSGDESAALPPVPPPPVGEEAHVAGATTPVPTRSGHGRTLAILAVALLVCLAVVAGGSMVAIKMGLLGDGGSGLLQSIPLLGKSTATADQRPSSELSPAADAGLTEDDLDKGPQTPRLASEETFDSGPLQGESAGDSRSTGVRSSEAPGTANASDVQRSAVHRAPAAAGELAQGERRGEGDMSQTGVGANAAHRAIAERQPTPVGVSVVTLGEPLLGGAVERELEKELSQAGVQLVDEHVFPDIERARAASDRDGTPSKELLELLARRCSAVVLTRIDPVSERELHYMGRNDTAWTADVLISVLETATGKPLSAGWRTRLEYTTAGVGAQTERAMAGCGQRLAPKLRGR